MELTAEQPLTKRQIASRKNGAKSKGPGTEEGKKKSSLNAIKHGLCGSVDNLLNSENIETHGAIKLALYQQYNPQTADEMMFVEDVTSLFWQLRRTYSMESEVFEQHEEGPYQHFAEGHGGVLLIQRYATTIRRSITQVTKLLQEIITNRRRANPHTQEESPWKEILSYQEPISEPTEGEPESEQTPKPSPRQLQREKLLKVVAETSKTPTTQLHPRQTHRRKPETA